ncbi:dynein axonemal intermediate chain 1-like [Uloborus diversus]|uniref:dynein axonemal intermediate chain 1-like n=1 Tax=Uloborus diversus TaxID=327109 RepID=UPI00240A342F|nr:dynein axonemal intermediate chain 1-like [Uloborus diversus]
MGFFPAGGTALSITGDSFAVGTTTGAIVLGSLEEKVGTADHVDHKHSVRSVQWNPYHPDVFLSCGKDFTVRIWHRSIRSSVFKFFFEQEVVDVRWAPFSSTLFAAISGNAVIHVFDLSTSKTEAVGTYTVYTAKQNSRLTVLRFHLFKPILMVGDDRGKVTVFKLSPNLRSSLKTLDSSEPGKYAANEKEKMEKLLASAKERVK